MLAPDGQTLAFCDRKKAENYIQKGLAEVASEDPPSIRLLFEPSGRDGADDIAYTSPRRNQCVVCGCKEGLTRHHIVPRCYRRHFPEEIKSHNSYDVMPLCIDHHDQYETSAMEFKKQISDETGIPIDPPVPDSMEQRQKAASLARALIKHGDRIPLDRQQEIRFKLSEFYGKEVGPRELEVLSETPKYEVSDENLHGYQVVVGLGDQLDPFVRRWRRHFLTTMEPKFLPENWDPSRTAAPSTE